MPLFHFAYWRGIKGPDLGRSLEEINMMMELRVPTRAWSQYQAGALDKHGRPVPVAQ